MSFWEYEAGRKACLENIASGDFSNGSVSEEDIRTKGVDYWKKWAKKELDSLCNTQNKV